MLTHGIAGKLIVRILALSCLLTLFSTSLLIYLEYVAANDHLEQTFEEIRTVHVPTLTESVWVGDRKMVALQLQGLAGDHEIHYLEVTADGLAPVSVGSEKDHPHAIRDFPLMYTYKNNERSLGTLIVAVGMEDVYRQLLNRAGYIFISEAVKIFFIAIFFCSLFQALVGRHLKQLADYTKDFDPAKTPSALALDRSARDDGNKDELDQLVVSINDMRRNIAEDIVRREEIESRLSQSERHYRELVENTEALILRVDSCGKILAVNRTAVDIFGFPVAQIVGMDMLQFVHPGDRQRTQIWFEKCLDARLPHGKIENRQVNGRTGQEVIMSWSCHFHYDDHGSLSYVSGIGHDLADRIQNEENLIKLRKLKATGVMAGGIAHDYNNLLAVIGGYAEMAREEVNPGEPIYAMLNTIGEVVDRASGLTKKFLTFSDGGLPVKNVAPLNLLLEQTAEAVLAGTTCYELNLPAGLWLVSYDAKQFQEAFTNILVNAKEAMPGGGTVRIVAENVTTENLGGNVSREMIGQNYVAVSIIDQGCGIAKNDLPKIFDPYFSSKEKGSQKGMGLGLTITSAIIHKHGGAISVDSESGIGTTVTIYLPAVSGKAAEQIAEQAAAAD